MTQKNTCGGGQSLHQKKKSLNETDNWWDDDGDGGPDGSEKQILRLKTRHSGSARQKKNKSWKRQVRKVIDGPTADVLRVKTRH